ncbi:MAG: YggS family pyridoxal phosphate-dependent enzyme [Pseudobdellovibrio sp.]
MAVSKDSARSLILNSLAPGQKILAVSKLQPVEKIEALYSEGQRDFGENYIQEALAKIETLKHSDIRWHLIGPIQKNKIKFLKKNFEYIHSVDNLVLAQKISDAALQLNYVQKVFIQLNLAEEETKSGYRLDQFEAEWPKLSSLKGISIVGLMTMPPLENISEKNRVFFKKLKYIGNKLNLTEFSMGTSHDYKIALQEGATWIRLGTTLFGERNQKRE